MNRKLLKFAVFFFLGQSVAVATELNLTADKYDINRLEAFVDGYVTGQMESESHTAVTLSIVKDKEVLLSKGYGKADIEKGTPVTPGRSLFRIGSTSKTFTYTAIMQLYEQGKLDLDVDVNVYLKDFKIPDTYEAPVTIRNILSHSAGFEDGGLGHMFVPNAGRIIPLREAAERYMPERVNPPGTRSAYSNYAVSLLGVIIEDVSGMLYEDYIETNIYTPLDMNNSTFRQPLSEAFKTDMTNTYKNENGRLAAQAFTLITHDAPAGGMSTTADDMAKFMLMHLGEGELNGQRVISPETARLMRSWLFGPSRDQPGMAYGFYQQEVNGNRLFGHAGGTLYFVTNMLMDPINNLGIFISATGLNNGDIVSQFVGTFYDYYLPGSARKSVSVSAAPDDFSEHANIYAGKYFGWRGNFSQLEKLMHLMNSVIVTPSERNTLLVSDSGDVTEYVKINTHLFQKVDGETLLVFREGADGDISDMHKVANPTITYTKGPFYYFKGFNFSMLGLSFIFFLTVVLGAIYRWKQYQTESVTKRKARYISLATSGTNILFPILMSLLISSHGFSLFHTLPWYFNLIMLFPIAASIFALVQLYAAIQVWRGGYWTLTIRMHYSFVVVSGLFMVWFYYFWNLLGFQYF